MHNLMKRRYGNKHGSSCRMCKPHKHHWADQRKLKDVRADLSLVEQLTALDQRGT